MAVIRKYTRQIPVVTTAAQREALQAEADRRGVSMALVVREMIDARYGLQPTVTGGPAGE